MRYDLLTTQGMSNSCSIRHRHSWFLTALQNRNPVGRGCAQFLTIVGRNIRGLGGGARVGVRVDWTLTTVGLLIVTIRYI